VTILAAFFTPFGARLDEVAPPLFFGVLAAVLRDLGEEGRREVLVTTVLSMLAQCLGAPAAAFPCSLRGVRNGLQRWHYIDPSSRKYRVALKLDLDIHARRQL